LSNKKLLTIEPTTPPHRVSRQSDTHPIEELNKTNSSQSTTKRKYSTNSLSPISMTSSIIKKRARNDSPVKANHSRNNKRKESQTEDDQSDDDTQTKSKVEKQKLNLNLSSKLTKYTTV
jgi:hypothetical protein